MRTRRTAANRIDVASRLSVRTTAACRLFPSGEALPSTTSAGSCLPLFDRFLGTTASSDFSSAYMLGVRLLPSRAGTYKCRTYGVGGWINIMMVSTRTQLGAMMMVDIIPGVAEPHDGEYPHPDRGYDGGGR